MDELNYNASHAADPTAKKAIKAADKPPDKPPENVRKFIKFVKYIASWGGLEIVGRITVRDKLTGIVYK